MLRRRTALIVVQALVAAAGVVVLSAPGAGAVPAPSSVSSAGAGSAVLVLGDSLTLGARDSGGLVARFAVEGVTADVVAETSRDTRWALAQVQARTVVPSEVVVFLGTNRIESDFRAGVEHLLDALAARGAQRVLWLTPLRFGDPGAYADRVAVLHDTAAARPALRIADWHLVAAAHPTWAAADHIHLTAEGYRALAGYAVDQHRSMRGPPSPTGAQRAASVVDAARAYVAALGRRPDGPGLVYWADRLATGTPLPAVAGALAASPEFAARFPSVDDGAFVDLVYRNVLDRLPDAAGRSYWLDQLVRGRGRGEVVATVGLSAEAVAAHLAVRLVGAVEPHAGAVARIYRVALGRDAEDGGLLFWTGRAWDGMGADDLAAALLRSPEHLALLGGTSDGDFVAALYRNGLGRPPDLAGMQYWVSALAAGIPRAALAAALASCEETRRSTGYLA